MAMGPILGPGRRGRRSPMAEINVTPMVDVMLVLLIIFMVTAPLLSTGIQVDLPESKAAPLDQEREPVSISIDAAGTVFVDDTQIA
ncbi:MAG: biopolymer transporter ExbD, partial [Allosphingosinicella sp.]